MVIAKDPSYLSLQYFMYSVTVVYHLTLCSLTEAVVNRTIHIICMYVYKWSVDIILMVYDNI